MKKISSCLYGEFRIFAALLASVCLVEPLGLAQTFQGCKGDKTCDTEVVKCGGEGACVDGAVYRAAQRETEVDASKQEADYFKKTNENPTRILLKTLGCPLTTAELQGSVTSSPVDCSGCAGQVADHIAGIYRAGQGAIAVPSLPGVAAKADQSCASYFATSYYAYLNCAKGVLDAAASDVENQAGASDAADKACLGQPDAGACRKKVYAQLAKGITVGASSVADRMIQKSRVQEITRQCFNSQEIVDAAVVKFGGELRFSGAVVPGALPALAITAPPAPPKRRGGNRSVVLACAFSEEDAKLPGKRYCDPKTVCTKDKATAAKHAIRLCDESEKTCIADPARAKKEAAPVCKEPEPGKSYCTTNQAMSSVSGYPLCPVVPGTGRSGAVVASVALGNNEKPFCVLNKSEAAKLGTKACDPKFSCAADKLAADKLKLRLCNPAEDKLCTPSKALVRKGLPYCAEPDPKAKYCTRNEAVAQDTGLALCKCDNSEDCRKDPFRTGGLGGPDGWASGCLDSIPNVNCADGGKYDRNVAAKKAAKKQGGADADAPAPVDIEPTNLEDFAKQLKLANTSYDMLKDDFGRELLEYKVELFMEKYLEVASLAGDVDELVAPEAMKTALEMASSKCSADAKGKIVPLIGQLPAAARINKSAKDAEKTMAWAGQCLSVVEPQYQALGKVFGNDIQLVSTLSEGMGDGAGASLARGALSILPGVSRTLNTPMLVGLTETGRRECGYAKLQAQAEDEITYSAPDPSGAPVELTAPRGTFCRAMWTEFQLLERERNQIYGAYPMLGEKGDGSKGASVPPTKTGYEHVASKGAIHHTISQYRATPGRTCMSLAQEKSAGAENQAAVDELPEKAVSAAGGVVHDKIQRYLNSYTVRIRELCAAASAHPPDQDELLGAINDSGLLSQYFDCGRKRFQTVGTTPDAAKAVSSKDCLSRRDASWLACRMNITLNAGEKRTEFFKTMGSEMLSIGMDAASFMMPLAGGGSFSVGHAAVGMGVGGFIGAALAPGADKLEAGYERDVAEYRAGFAGIATYERAAQGMQKLAAEASPRAKAFIEGAIPGILAGFIPKEQLGSKTSSGLLKDSEARNLLKAYRILKKEGLFARSSAGAAIEHDLETALRNELKMRAPNINVTGGGATGKALSMDKVLAKLDRLVDESIKKTTREALAVARAFGRDTGALEDAAALKLAKSYRVLDESVRALEKDGKPGGVVEFERLKSEAILRNELKRRMPKLNPYAMEMSEVLQRLEQAVDEPGKPGQAVAHAPALPKPAPAAAKLPAIALEAAHDGTKIEQTTTRGPKIELGEPFHREEVDFHAARDHIARHHGGQVAGSQFNPTVFPTPEDVEAYVRSRLPPEPKYDQFGRAEYTFTASLPGGEPVGYTGVLSEAELKKRFPGAKIETRPRDPGGIPAVVDGVQGSWYPELERDSSGKMVVARDAAGKARNPHGKFVPDAKIALVPEEQLRAVSATDKLTVVIQKDARTGKPVVETIFPGEPAPPTPAKIPSQKTSTIALGSVESRFWSEHVFVKPEPKTGGGIPGSGIDPFAKTPLVVGVPTEPMPLFTKKPPPRTLAADVGAWTAESVPTGSRDPSYVGLPSHGAWVDPYFTGPQVGTYPYYAKFRERVVAAGKRTPDFPPADWKPEGYSYTPPAKIDLPLPAEKMHFEFPDAPVKSRLLDAMGPGQTVERNATKLGTGGSSVAYLIHDPIPNDVMANIAKLPAPFRKSAARNWVLSQWELKQSGKVIKVRMLKPGRSARGAAEWIRRDAFAYQLATKAVDSFTVSGRKILRVARTEWAEVDVRRGIIRQEAVAGPTAFELQRALHEIQAPGKYPPDQVWAAKKLIAKSGLSEAEMQRQIWCLEQFYRDTHPMVRQAEHANKGMNLLANELPDKSMAGIGFDYNHGVNVIWDSATRQFVMIDW